MKKHLSIVIFVVLLVAATCSMAACDPSGGMIESLFGRKQSDSDIRKEPSGGKVAEAPAVSGISVKESKSEYEIGEEFAPGKLIVEYDNGETKEIELTKDMASGFDASAAGEKTLTIKYEGKETTFAYSVKAPDKYEFDLTGVWAAYPLGTKRLSGALGVVKNGVRQDNVDVSALEATGLEPNRRGRQEISIEYEGNVIPMTIGLWGEAAPIVAEGEKTENPMTVEQLAKIVARLEAAATGEESSEEGLRSRIEALKKELGNTDLANCGIAADRAQRVIDEYLGRAETLIENARLDASDAESISEIVDAAITAERITELKEILSGALEAVDLDRLHMAFFRPEGPTENEGDESGILWIKELAKQYPEVDAFYSRFDDRGRACPIENFAREECNLCYCIFNLIEPLVEGLSGVGSEELLKAAKLAARIADTILNEEYDFVSALSGFGYAEAIESLKTVSRAIKPAIEKLRELPDVNLEFMSAKRVAPVAFSVVDSLTPERFETIVRDIDAALKADADAEGDEISDRDRKTAVLAVDACEALAAARSALDDEGKRSFDVGLNEITAYFGEAAAIDDAPAFAEKYKAFDSKNLTDAQIREIVGDILRPGEGDGETEESLSFRWDVFSHSVLIKVGSSLDDFKAQLARMGFAVRHDDGDGETIRLADPETGKISDEIEFVGFDSATEGVRDVTVRHKGASAKLWYRTAEAGIAVGDFRLYERGAAPKAESELKTLFFDVKPDGSFAICPGKDGWTNEFECNIYREGADTSYALFDDFAHVAGVERGTFGSGEISLVGVDSAEPSGGVKVGFVKTVDPFFGVLYYPVRYAVLTEEQKTEATGYSAADGDEFVEVVDWREKFEGLELTGDGSEKSNEEVMRELSRIFESVPNFCILNKIYGYGYKIDSEHMFVDGLERVDGAEKTKLGKNEVKYKGMIRDDQEIVFALEITGVGFDSAIADGKIDLSSISAGDEWQYVAKSDAGDRNISDDRDIAKLRLKFENKQSGRYSTLRLAYDDARKVLEKFGRGLEVEPANAELPECGSLDVSYVCRSERDGRGDVKCVVHYYVYGDDETVLTDSPAWDLAVPPVSFLDESGGNWNRVCLTETERENEDWSNILNQLAIDEERIETCGAAPKPSLEEMKNDFGKYFKAECVWSEDEPWNNGFTLMNVAGQPLKEFRLTVIPDEDADRIDGIGCAWKEGAAFERFFGTMTLGELKEKLFAALVRGRGHKYEPIEDLSGIELLIDGVPATDDDATLESGKHMLKVKKDDFESEEIRYEIEIPEMLRELEFYDFCAWFAGWGGAAGGEEPTRPEVIKMTQADIDAENCDAFLNQFFLGLESVEGERFIAKFESVVAEIIEAEDGSPDRYILRNAEGEELANLGIVEIDADEADKITNIWGLEEGLEEEDAEPILAMLGVPSLDECRSLRDIKNRFMCIAQWGDGHKYKILCGEESLQSSVLSEFYFTEESDFEGWQFMLDEEAEPLTDDRRIEAGEHTLRIVAGEGVELARQFAVGSSEE